MGIGVAWAVFGLLGLYALPTMVFLMMFALIVFRCVAILIYYRRGVGHDEA